LALRVRYRTVACIYFLKRITGIDHRFALLDSSLKLHSEDAMPRCENKVISTRQSTKRKEIREARKKPANNSESNREVLIALQEENQNQRGLRVNAVIQGREKERGR
jgi:hypothetical protein